MKVNMWRVASINCCWSLLHQYIRCNNSNNNNRRAKQQIASNQCECSNWKQTHPRDVYLVRGLDAKEKSVRCNFWLFFWLSNHIHQNMPNYRWKIGAASITQVKYRSGVLITRPFPFFKSHISSIITRYIWFAFRFVCSFTKCSSQIPQWFPIIIAMSMCTNCTFSFDSFFFDSSFYHECIAKL